MLANIQNNKPVFEKSGMFMVTTSSEVNNLLEKMPTKHVFQVIVVVQRGEKEFQPYFKLLRILAGIRCLVQLKCLDSLLNPQSYERDEQYLDILTSGRFVFMRLFLK